MSLSSLQVLVDNRNALLLAEVAAWLHDMGKCTDDFIRYEEARGFKATKSRAKKPGRLNPHKAVFVASDLSRFAFSNERRPEREEEAENRYALHHLLGDEILQCLDKSPLTIFGAQYTIRELIYFGRPGFAGRTRQPLGKEGLPADYLGRCHGAAHVEKEESDNQTSVPSSTVTEASSVFGVEIPLATDLTNRLRGLPFAAFSNRNRFREAVSESFAGVVADTRRPENEVMLWDWANIVAALYKAALAGALLGYKPKPADLRWRLLSVRVDSAAFVENIARIPDLLARQGLLRDGFERVRRLLEETYPLATRVYQDQDNSIYIVPNVANLLEATDAQGRTLSALIRAEFEKGTVKEEKLALKGEVISAVQLDTREWQAQRLDRTFDVPPIAKLLKEGVSTCADHNQVTDWWRDQKDAALCPVCRLRPMREKREACEHCEGRRQSRIELWERDPSKTIWLDEIADHKDRVALIVGKFGLDDWLSGEMVQTLLVKAVANDPDKCAPKNPSPVRLRRVWETTQKFWTETVEQEILAKYAYADKMKNSALRRARVAITTDQTHWEENKPYDGTINGQTVSLLWLKDQKRFVTISNLQLGATQSHGPIELVAEWHGRVCQVSEPDKPNQRREFDVRGVELLTDDRREYAPYLPLLSSPDQFLALAPAGDALAIAEKIREEYGNQFGKVQNRLPLFLGIVFFQRKTPLMAVMDTARRMLKQVEWKGDELWIVQDKQEELPNVKLRLSKDNQTIEYTVRVKMGDDATDDVWYPYFFVEGNVADRKHRFEFKDESNPKSKYAGRALVHAGDLRVGDTVRVQPSRFAYIYLDHTAQRFRFDPNRDVMLLDELPRLVEMWKDICDTPNMSDTKLQTIGALFESKRQLWRLDEKDGDVEARRKTFRDLVETTFKRDGVKRISPDEALNGNFQRCLDLYLHILKRRVKEEKHEQQPETV